MYVMNRNWSARKQHLHLQSVTGISRHSALSEDRIRQCGTLSRSRCEDRCMSPFPLTGTAMSLFRVKMVKEEGQNPVAGLWGRTLARMAFKVNFVLA